MNPIELWHSIIDAEAAYEAEHGNPPKKLKLPVQLAYDLAKLGHEQLGELWGRVMKSGIVVFEEEGLLGVSVEIVRDASTQFSFE